MLFTLAHATPSRARRRVALYLRRGRYILGVAGGRKVASRLPAYALPPLVFRNRAVEGSGTVRAISLPASLRPSPHPELSPGVLFPIFFCVPVKPHVIVVVSNLILQKNAAATASMQYITVPARWNSPTPHPRRHPFRRGAA